MTRAPHRWVGSFVALLLLGPAGVTAVASKRVVGEAGYVRTALGGGSLVDIPLEYLGTIKDFAGPGYDLYLVELKGPEAEEIGIAAGMSGSPVYFEDRIVGALAYRFGRMPKRAVAGVTPLEQMIDADRRSSPPSASADAMIRPISTPVLGAGLLPEVRDWLAPRIAEHGLTLVAGGQVASADVTTSELEPGSAVGVQLVRGDLSVAATGTVTWIDGDRVYAFGHPFLGTGRVEMPMITADVVHTLADSAGSFKLSNIGVEVGAIVEDRVSAIVGRKSVRAAMIPLQLRVRGADYHDESFDFEIVRNSPLSPLMTATALLNALQGNNGQLAESTVRAAGMLRFHGLPDLPLNFVATGEGGGNPNFDIAVSLYGVLSSLWSNPYAVPPLERVELEIHVEPEIVAYALTDVRFDRRPSRPGSALELTLDLRRYRGGIEARKLVVPIPERLQSGQPLELVVGSTDQIQRLLGAPLVRRLGSAPDLASIVRVLADVPGPNRIGAVVLERGHAAVSRGALYENLPPTIQKLLSTQRREEDQRTAPEASALAIAWIDLDGPVSGGFRARLQIDGRLETEEVP